MNNVINIKVHRSLQEVLETLRKQVAEEMKKKYNLTDITVYGTLASEILAAKERGRKEIDFRIRKIGLNKGVLELIN